MPVAQYSTYSSYQLCYVRATPLDDRCFPVGTVYEAPAPSPDDCEGIVTVGAVSIASSPEIETGEELQVKNGCGTVVAYKKDCDRIKGHNITLDMAIFDLQLIQMLTDTTLIVDNVGAAIGYASPPKDCAKGVTLEAWTKTAIGRATCGGSIVGNNWFHWIWPNIKMTLQDITLQNDFATVSITGFSEGSPAYSDAAYYAGGPYGDWKAGTNNLVFPGDVSEVVHLSDIPADFDDLFTDSSYGMSATQSFTCKMITPPTPATGATAGTPGTYSPVGAAAPKNISAIRSQSVTATPGTAWTTGQYVLLADSSSAYWDSNSWEVGTAP